MAGESSQAIREVCRFCGMVVVEHTKDGSEHAHGQPLRVSQDRGGNRVRMTVCDVCWEKNLSPGKHP